MSGWDQNAVCKGTPTEVFFPSQFGGSFREARQLCGRCPVRQECLEAALNEETATDQRHGMRGGKTPDERRQIAKAAA